MLFNHIIKTVAFVATASAHAVHFPRGADPQGFGKTPLEFGPLPDSAKGLDVSKLGYAVQDFGGGAYMITEGSYTTMFLTYDEGVILVDAPPTIGHKLEYAIGNITDKPVTHLIYSHSHSDHIGAGYLFGGSSKKGYGGKKTTIISHAITQDLLKQRKDPARPVPNVSFEKSYKLKVGNQTLELSYKGANHEPGNIFIWAPKQKVVMVVDIIYPGFVPFAELAQSTDIPNWIAAHDQILEYDFKHFVTGHLNRDATREDVKIQKEYVNDLFNNCKTVIEKGTTDDKELGAGNMLGPVFQKYHGNGWAAFKVYLDTTSVACAKMTNEKWSGKLGGWDAFGVENAYKMIEVLRIDYGILGPFGVSP